MIKQESFSITLSVLRVLTIQLTKGGHSQKKCFSGCLKSLKLFRARTKFQIMFFSRKSVVE